MAVKEKDINKQGEAVNNDLRKTKDELAQKEKELNALREEFSAFAATIAHDIKSPFRGIGVFLDMIKDSIKTGKGAETDEYFERIYALRDRISILAEDLMVFSAVLRNDFTSGKVETSGIIEDTLKKVEDLVQEKNAKVIVKGDLPPVKGDEGQISQLFRHIIANALKFNANVPEIIISADISNGYAEFSVKDNGIGIDPKYFSKIFENFQRLNSLEEYPGTGLGLAACKRVAQNHNGKIWLESETGKGSVFYFTLPLANK